MTSTEEEQFKLAGILADLREDGIISYSNGSGYQIERKFPDQQKYTVSLSYGVLVLTEKTFSGPYESTQEWSWKNGGCMNQYDAQGNSLPVSSEFLITQVKAMMEHLSVKKLIAPEEVKPTEKMKTEDQILVSKKEEEPEKKEETTAKKEVLPVEAEEISEADLAIYQKWIKNLIEKLNQSCGYGPIYEKKDDLKNKLLVHLIETRGQFVDLDSIKQELKEEEAVSEDQIMRQKMEGLDLINRYSRDGARCWRPCTINDDLETIQSVVKSMEKDLTKKTTEQQEKKLNSDQKGFYDLLEKEKIPMIGKLSDHIVQNGVGRVERATKKLIREHGYKVIKSWWEEYRSLEIDF